MLDLACHAWFRPLTVITAMLVRPFAWLDRHALAVRWHGYLLATVVSPGAVQAPFQRSRLDREADEGQH